MMLTMSLLLPDLKYLPVSGGGGVGPPTVTAGGCLILQEPTDLTWHCLRLIDDGGEKRLFVDQANLPDPGHRGYYIQTADDLTKHKLEIRFEPFAEPGQEYQWYIHPDNSAEAPDGSQFNLGVAGFPERYPVTMFLEPSGETVPSYGLHVDQTPVP